MAVQVDRQACVAFIVRPRHQHDLIDQLADDLRRLHLGVLVAQRFAEGSDLVAVVVRHVGMNENGVIRRVLDPRLGLQFAVLKVRHLLFDAAGRHTVHQRLHQPVKLALDLHERRPVHLVPGVALAAQPVHVARVLLAEFIAQRRVHEAALQTFQHRGFERVAANSMPVVAGPLVAGVRAADPLGIEDDEPAPAAAAAHQAGEEVVRASPVPITAFLLAGARAAQRLLPNLDRLPQIFRNDPQVRHVLRDPLRFRIGTRDALAGFRVLDVAQPVPDQLADIKLVVEDASAPIRVAVDRARSPIRAGRAGHGFLVELLGNRLRRLARRILVEYASHDPGLRGVDLPLAAHRQPLVIEPTHHVIAEGIPAARLARLDAPAQAAPRLVGKVFEEQRAHRAFQADMQLVHFAFGEGDNPHAGKARALVDVGDILLVARQPVDRLGDDHLELARLRILQEHLHAGADQAGARDRMIGVAVDDAPALALRALLAQANLILDRGVALQVGGIAGVDNGGRHDEFISYSPCGFGAFPSESLRQSLL